MKPWVASQIMGVLWVIVANTTSPEYWYQVFAYIIAIIWFVTSILQALTTRDKTL